MAVTAEKVVVELELRDGQYLSRVRANERVFSDAQKRTADSAERAERRIRASSDRIASSLRGMAAGLTAGLSAGAIIGLTDAYTRYTNQLRVAGLEGVSLKNVQTELFGIAQQYGIQLESLGQLYGRLSQSANELGASQAELLQFTTGVSAALKIQGGDASSSAGALLQLSQALGGSIVRAEEFNSINEGARPILQAVANGIERYRGSISALRRDVIEGKVSSAEFFEGFLEGSADLEAQAAKAALTTSQAFTTLQNALVQYFGEANSASGASAALGAAIKGVADNLDVLIPAIAVLATALGVGLAANAIAAKVAADGATLSFNRMRVAALAAFGGPVGLAITAVTIALGYFAAEAAKGSVAATNARSVLDDLARQAERTRSQVDQLAYEQIEQGNASDVSAAKTDGAASAYNRARIAALNAAEAIKYMTAVQRQSLLEELENSRRGLVARTSGGVFDLVTTDSQERINNSRARASRALGVNPGQLPSAQDIETASGRAAIERARAALTGGGLSPQNARAVQEFVNAVAVYREETGNLIELNSAIEEVRANISAPTLAAPEETGARGGTAAATGSGRGRAGASGPTAAELAAMREEIRLSGELALAKSRNDEIEARRIQRLIDINSLTEQYTRAQIANARELATAQVDAIAANEANERQVDRWLEESERNNRRRVEAEQAIRAEQESRLQLELELARLGGDYTRVEALERELELLRRIAEYGPGREGQARQDQGTINNARDEASEREQYREYARTFVDALRSGNLWEDLGERFADAAANNLENALSTIFTAIFANQGQGANALNGIGSFLGFGGGRARGGPVRAGFAYDVGENGREKFVAPANGFIMPNMGAQASNAGRSQPVIVQLSVEEGAMFAPKVQAISGSVAVQTTAQGVAYSQDQMQQAQRRQRQRLV